MEGYYDPRDVYTTVPRSTILSTPYADHVRDSVQDGALRGLRIGVIRESMLMRPGGHASLVIPPLAAQEIKSVLGEKLGATLLESRDPMWPPDPDLEVMTTD